MSPEGSFRIAHDSAALRVQGRLGEALTLARKVRDETDAPEAHWNLSLVELQIGLYAEGWRSFEWRKKRAKQPFGIRTGPEPEWDLVSDLSDKHILLHAEQGMGDAIMFARYVPLVMQRARQVTFEVHPGLVPLLQTVAPGLPVFEIGQAPPGFDCHCPLMSLPLAFRTTLETVPAPIPYLAAEARRVDIWRERLGAQGFKIGIVWQGNPRSGADQGRSMYVSEFGPLSRVPRVRLISLQKGAGTEQLAALNGRATVEELGPDFDAGPGAFLDTAAIMQSLDLVVTVDTAIAHLAGALGRPCWIVLKVGHDWRWLTERVDSPWYPTVRLYRQEQAGDWASPMQAIAEDLRVLLS